MKWYLLGLTVYLLIGFLSYWLSLLAIRKRIKKVFFPFDVHSCFKGMMLWPLLPVATLIGKKKQDVDRQVVYRLTVFKIKDDLYRAVAEYIGTTLEADGSTDIEAHANVSNKALALFGAKGVGAGKGNV